MTRRRRLRRLRRLALGYVATGVALTLYRVAALSPSGELRR